MDKYHVALSFAGEDRKYVEIVANTLKDNGVQVFYDKFEETNLWGKDLYTYLNDIYKNRAFYTVMFVSSAYKDKLWTNHERESAQSRALTESREYILPAKFEDSIEIPGLNKTTGYISLKGLLPEDFAKKIISKLEKEKVIIISKNGFSYSKDAKADVDFPLPLGEEFSKIIKNFRSYSWPTQNSAIELFYKSEWSSYSEDQLFLVGRNIYQCACGSERRSTSIVKNLRREMAKFPQEIAEHIINGMFYEVYFNHEGVFRGFELKGMYLEELFAIQTVTKFKKCIDFIRECLKPYVSSVAIIPNEKPEIVTIDITLRKTDPPTIESIKNNGKELLFEPTDSDDAYRKLWKLSLRKFTIDDLREELSNAWYIPLSQLVITCNNKVNGDTEFKLPHGKSIKPPFSI